MSSDIDNLFKPIVLVTGFGPFVNVPVNPSWEAVKLMNKDKIEKKHNVELVQLEIPVLYDNVDEFVPALWETHTPKLMIHVGVSSIANDITLEKQAHKKGYIRMDYMDQCPPNNVCPADGAIRMQTQLNVDRLCDEFNSSNPTKITKAVCSYDAGRYLCEYIYYRSLSVDNTRTLFVHVPRAEICDVTETAKGLERILDLCMTQIVEKESIEDVTNQLSSSDIQD